MFRESIKIYLNLSKLEKSKKKYIINKFNIEIIIKLTRISEKKS